MRRRVIAAGLASLVVAALFGGAMAPSAGASSAARPAGDYIVVLADGTDAPATASEHARSYGAKVGHVYRYALRGYSAHLSATAVARIAADTRVAAVQPDVVVTATAQTLGTGIDRVELADGADASATAAELPTGIDRVDAELSPTAGIDGVDSGVDVDVAVLSTGVDLDHPDLNVLTSRGRNCTDERGLDDLHGGGTVLAGTIGARDNGIGVVGVAPGARIWPIKVLESNGMGNASTLLCGIDYVTRHASKIEVAELGYVGYSRIADRCGLNDEVQDAVCASVAAGVTHVGPAGNFAGDAQYNVPAQYDEVIAVSALADFDGQPGGLFSGPTCHSVNGYDDEDDTFADFSDYGADIDLIAPGVCIPSSTPGGGYNSGSGTGTASAHVAGAAALYKATHPNASPAQVKAALQAAATTDWNNADDPDGIKEKLLNVAAF